MDRRRLRRLGRYPEPGHARRRAGHRRSAHPGIRRRSLIDFGEAVPALIDDLRQVSAWCPSCFVGGSRRPEEGLDTYLALVDSAYRAPPLEVARARNLAEQHGRFVAGSAYLGALVPETADMHNILGIGLAGSGRMDEAIAEFREALRLDPGSAQTHWHLGAALAYRVPARRQSSISASPCHWTRPTPTPGTISTSCSRLTRVVERP